MSIEDKLENYDLVLPEDKVLEALPELEQAKDKYVLLDLRNVEVIKIRAILNIIKYLKNTKKIYVQNAKDNIALELEQARIYKSIEYLN